MRSIQGIFCFLLPAAAIWAQGGYVISTVAGNGRLPFVGHGGPATNALLVQPEAVVADAQGNFYFCDSYYERVLRVSAAGVITVFAGNGVLGPSGDGGPAIDASLGSPRALAIDAAGNLVVADSANGRIRVIDTSGNIRTVAGGGLVQPFDGLAARGAVLGFITAVTIDPAGRIVFAEDGAARVWAIESPGVLRLLAGGGRSGFAGDGTAARGALLSGPRGLAFNRNGDLFIADSNNFRIRRVDASGIINTFAGNGQFGNAGDGGQATQAQLTFPTGMVTDANGNLFFSDFSFGAIRQVTPGGIISTVVPGTASRFLIGPNGIAIEPSGNLLVAVLGGRSILRITPQRVVTVVAGTFSTSAPGEGQPAVSAYLLGPAGVAADAARNILVSDFVDNRIKRVTASDSILRTFAGTGFPAMDGNGGPALQAGVGNPQALLLTTGGDLLFSFFFGAGMRIIRGGVVNAFAGTGQLGFSGDSGSALAATFNGTDGFAMDGQGNVYLADLFNHRVRRINAANIVTTFAGTGVEGYSGDGGLATAAQLSQPTNVAVDRNGVVYISDSGNLVIRCVDTSGRIATCLGAPTTGVQGDPGPTAFTGMAFDAQNNFYTVAQTRGRILRVTPNRVASAIAGDGSAGFSGDGGNALAARFLTPGHLTVAPNGEIFFSDGGNYRVRALTPVEVLPPAAVNAASFEGSDVAPGEIATIFVEADSGPAALTTAALDSNGRVATLLAGTRVLFDETPAPLVYTSRRQISAIVPYSVAGKAQVRLRIEFQGATTVTGTLRVVATAPGIFTYPGGRRAVVVNQDGTFNAPDNRSAIDSVAVAFATGEGQTEPAGLDGQIAAAVFPKPVAPVEVLVGGVRAEIVYVGAAPGVVAGLLQVNFRIPRLVAPGAAVPLVLRIGNAVSQDGVTFAVR